MPVGTKQPRADKVEAVGEIKEILKNGTLILTNFQGLDVKSLSNMRSKLRESGSGCTVVKNTLLILAAADTDVAPLTEGLKGPTAIVYTDEDPVAAAKVLKEFTKGPAPIHLKGGMVDGQIFDEKQIELLANIPPKQELYAMVVGGLQSPITGLVGTLQSMMSQLVMTLQGVADKKSAA